MNEDKDNKGLSLINVSSFWSRGFLGADSTIAVIDTGCDVNHEALRENILGGMNFTSDNSFRSDDYNDINGHGTHVAGIIAANNIKKTVGVAPKSKLLILKAINDSGYGNLKNVVNSIFYAVNWRGLNGEKVNIITLSLATKEDNYLLKKAVDYALINNVAVVVAAGNDGDGKHTTEISYPGAYNSVIEVGSINYKKESSFFSNTNNQIDLVAPGEDILSTFTKNSYKLMSGTSMAAPFVAGSMALIAERGRILLNRELSEKELYAQLIKSTKRHTKNALFEGNGVLDLGKSFD